MRIPEALDDASAEARQPGLRFVMLTCALAYATCFTLVVAAANFRELVTGRFDSPAYLPVADAIRTWSPAPADEMRFFRGFPFAIAAVASALHISSAAAMLAISVVTAFVAIALCQRLYGPRVAMSFAILNLTWISFVVIGGGAEPLFMALLLGGLLAARHEKFAWSSFLGSLATTVRAPGIFLIAAVVGWLLLARRYKEASRAALLACVVGAVYALALRSLGTSPLDHWRGYEEDWYGRWPIALPLVPIIKGLALDSGRWTTRAFHDVWIGVVIVGLAVGFLRRSFARHLLTRTEVIYAVLATLFLFSYNSVSSVDQFGRFAMVMLPFALIGLEDYLPKGRWPWLAIAVVCGFMAAASLAGVAQLRALLP
jgi:hypothetical protein